VPNDTNAHPQTSNSGNLVVVHNGIIENYASLKKELIHRGFTFSSDTDTEVLVNLIEDVQQQQGVKLGQAVQIALSQVIGAYAIVVFDRRKPNELVAARLGSPLAIGIGGRKRVLCRIRRYAFYRIYQRSHLFRRRAFGHYSRG
jgi:glucosamine--fructose-6-phosphate aminotransferase (isomerizing)